MLFTILALLFLVLSLIGMCARLDSTGIDRCFIPVTLLSCIAMIMYVAGILNAMPLTAIVVYITGIVLFFSERKRIIAYFSAPRYGELTLLTVAFIYLIWYCRGAVYADGDTMTHWGVVIREMCELDRMPNFSTREVSYQSYPTGMAGLIYFFCKIFGGYSEGRAMFVQGIFVVSCLLSLFVFVKGKKTLLKGSVVCCSIVYMLHYNIALDDMKVDNAIALLTLSVIIIVLTYYDEPDKAILFTAAQMCFLQIIKNSGMIFWLFALLPLGYIAIKQKKKDVIIRFTCVSILLPLLTIYIWDCHTDLVFLSADTTRHSASITNLLNVAHSRPKDEFAQISKNFFKVWLDFTRTRNTSGEWGGIISCLSVLGIGGILRRVMLKDKSSKEILGGITVGLCYLIHKVMLLGMYMFNMPDSDALIIGAYARYMDSVAVILYGIAICYVLSIWNEIENANVALFQKTACILFMLCCCAIMPIVKPEPFNSLKRPDYASAGLYRKLVVLQKQYKLPERDAKILVYTKTPYSGFFVTYCFRSVDAYSIDVDGFTRAMNDTPGYYDYLIVIDHDELIDAELEKRSMALDESIYFL